MLSGLIGYLSGVFLKLQHEEIRLGLFFHQESKEPGNEPLHNSDLLRLGHDG